MGFLNLFQKRAATPLRIPKGCISLDSKGQPLSGTIPSDFPKEVVSKVGAAVLGTFREAMEARIPLQEITIHYRSLRITAKSMRGGAMIFLVPLMMSSPDTLNPKTHL
jgi:hypothetical protein